MILLFIILFVVFVIVAELFLRIYIWKNSFRNILVESKYKQLSYELRPSFKRYLRNKLGENVFYESNSLGIRGKEILDEKTKKRVLVIGDSIIYGFGVDEKNTFPRLLEKQLNKNSKKYEVINAGVGPYNIIQIYHAFKLKWLKLQPDVVILAINISNFIKYSDWYLDKKTGNIRLKYPQQGSFKSSTQGPLKGRLGRIGRLIDKLYIFRYWVKPFILSLIFKKDSSMENKLGNSDALDKFVFCYSKKGKLWDQRKKYLKRLKTLCDQKKIKLLTVAFPLTSQYEENEKGYPQAVIEKYCKQVNILNINLFSSFSIVINKPKKITKYFFDFIHLTPLGNKLVAKKISDFILKNKLI